MKQMNSRDRAESFLIGAKGRLDIESMTDIMVAGRMFDHLEDKDMIRLYQKQATRQLLSSIKKTVILENGDTVKVRGCYNIKQYRRGVMIREYVLVDFMTEEEFQDLINTHRDAGKIRLALADKLESIIPRQMKIWGDDI